MKRLRTWIIISVGFLLFGNLALADEFDTAKSDSTLTFSGIVSGGDKKTATVMAISQDKQSLTLQTKPNAAETVPLEPEGGNASQIQVGDKIIYERYQYVNARVLSPDTRNSAQAYANGTSDARFGDPAENVKHAKHATIAEITDLDRYYRRVTLTAPFETLIVTADSDDDDFSEIQKHDSVFVDVSTRTKISKMIES